MVVDKVERLRRLFDLVVMRDPFDVLRCSGGQARDSRVHVAQGPCVFGKGLGRSSKHRKGWGREGRGV